MAWDVEGTYFETCNCVFACPCTVTSFATAGTEERCRVILAFHVNRGSVDGVDVSGHSAAVVADAPAKMMDGNWRVGILVDDKASKEQVDKLAGVFSGQLGGPMGALAPLVGEVMGVEQQPIEFREAGHKHHLKIGHDISVDVEDFVPNGMPEPTRLAGIFHPSNTTLTVARPTAGHVKAFGLDFETTDRSAFSAPFHWSA